MQSHQTLHDFIKNRTPERLVRSLKNADIPIDVNETNERGLTLLQQAVREGMTEAALCLIYAGADIDGADQAFESKNSRDIREAKKTPLYFAASNEDPLLAQILIICGADLDVVKEKAEEFKEPEVERFLQNLKINTDICYGILFWHINHFSSPFNDRLLQRLLPYIQKSLNTPDEVSIEIIDRKEEKKSDNLNQFFFVDREKKESSIEARATTQTNFMLSLQQLTAFAAKKENAELARQLNQFIKYKIDIESDDVFQLTPAYHAATNNDFKLYATLCGDNVDLRALTLAQLEWNNCSKAFDALIVHEKAEVLDKAVEISAKLKYGSKPKPPLELKEMLAYEQAIQGRNFVFYQWEVKEFYQIAAFAYQQKNFIALETIMAKLDGHFKFELGDKVLNPNRSIYLKKDKEKLRYTLNDFKSNKDISDVITQNDIPDLDLKKNETLTLEELAPLFKDILKVITRRGHRFDPQQCFLKEILENQNYSLALFWLTAANIDIYDFILKSVGSCLAQDKSLADSFWQTLIPHCTHFRLLRRLSLSHGILNKMPPRFNDILFNYFNSFCDPAQPAGCDLLDCIQDQYECSLMRFLPEDNKVVSQDSLTNEDQIRVHDIFLRFSLPVFFDVLLPELMIKNLMPPPLWRIIIGYLEREDRQKMTELAFLREYALQVEFGFGFSYQMELKEKFLALSAFIKMINLRITTANWCSERWDACCGSLTAISMLCSAGLGLMISFIPKFDKLRRGDWHQLVATINPKSNHTCALDYYYNFEYQLDYVCSPFKYVKFISEICEDICQSMESNQMHWLGLLLASVFGSMGVFVLLSGEFGLIYNYCFKKNERLSLTRIADFQAEFNSIFAKLKILFPTEYDDSYLRRSNVVSSLDLATKLLNEIKELNPKLFGIEKKEDAKLVPSRTNSRTLSRTTFFKRSISRVDAKTPLLDRSRNTSIQTRYTDVEPVISSLTATFLFD